MPQGSICTDKVFVAADIQDDVGKYDEVLQKLNVPSSASVKDAAEKVLKEALELPVSEKDAVRAKPKPPLKVYEPPKKSSSEILEYYETSGPKRFRLYYYLRRVLRYSLITANIIVFFQFLYCICKIEGLI